MSLRKIFLLMILLLPSCALFGQYELAICSIFCDEGTFLKEWLEFHKLQGVQHFYLYNHNSRDNFQSVLDPYIKRGEVTLIPWEKQFEPGERAKWLAIQTGAYSDCLKRFGDETRWLAVIDVDEFLFCPSGMKLPCFLQAYLNFPAIGVSWLMFGTSEVEEIPDGDLMIEHLTRCATLANSENHFYKSIVQPSQVESCPNPHYFHYKNGQVAVNSAFRRLPPQLFCQHVLLDDIRLNHYYTRHAKHLREVKMQDVQNRFNRSSSSGQLRHIESFNDTEDRAILQFVPELRSQMSPISVP